MSNMNTALLIVDIQNDYFPGGKNELPGSVEAGINAGKLLAAFRQNGLPVLHIQHISIRAGATFFLPGSTGAEINGQVRAMPNEPVIVKHYPSSFRETGLLENIKTRNVERLVICGMMTNMCIDSTTRAAFDLGFSCIVAHDACAAKNIKFGDSTIPAEIVHKAFLGAMDGTFAKVLATEQILKEMPF